MPPLQAFTAAATAGTTAATTGPASASAFYAYWQAAHLAPGALLHGTFDLDPEITRQIEAGVTLFGIDQQPYLQGYLAVLWLALIQRYGFTPATPIVSR